MARDIRLVWNESLLEGDLLFQEGDLLREPGLQTAVIISLFTNRRADEGDPLDNPNDKQGWWGDQISEIQEDQIGSRLWILSRAKTTQENINLAKYYIEESLEWMIEDGIVAKIEVEVERQERKGKGTGDVLTFAIKFFKIDGNTEEFKFEDLWEGQFS